jgi:peroxiredoxin
LEKEFWQVYKNKGAAVVAVAVWAKGDPTQQAKAFAQEHHLSFPVLVDAKNQVAAKYGVNAVPTNLVLDKKGAIRYRGEGFDPQGIKQALEAAMKEAGAKAPQNQ